MDGPDELPVEGDVVASKYRVERLVGEGAMGRVFRARHLLLGHDVAIKLLRTSVGSDELRTRFMREAKATMALRSDHIVRVFDLGVLPSNTPYMVLEYLEGTDLRALLETRGALPVAETVDYVLQACEALAEAHLNGIVHRDLKPQNLFLTRRSNGTACIKLLDFGVSKFEARSDSKDELTMSHALLGSPVFMSPEQVRDSRKVDARADVWSVGVVLYMLLGGGRPFGGEGLAGTCAAIMVDPPRPLAARCPSVPAELEAVIFGCLEKSRERRTPDVAALATLLQPFASPAGRVSAERVVHLFASSPPLARGPAAAAPLRSEGPAAPTPSPAQEVTALESTTVDAGPPAGAARRGRGQLLLASAFVLLALAVGVGWARRRASGAPTATESASQAAQAALSGSADLAGRALVAARPGDSPEPVEVPPAVAVTAGTSRRAAGAAARGGKPALPASSARKKGQVDRNGVPILE